MKLYTEETLIEGFTKYFNMSKINAMNIVDLLTPIELPSDEEIENEAEKVYPISKKYKEKLGANNYDDFNDCWNEGAKWMKEQILNQNK